MSAAMQEILQKYVNELKCLYGTHLRAVILYGSYARGDYNSESDIDIMILLDIDDLNIKNFRHELSELTYVFNMEYDLDIKPIAKNEEHFKLWQEAYPFYENVKNEGVRLFEAA